MILKHSYVLPMELCYSLCSVHSVWKVKKKSIKILAGHGKSGKYLYKSLTGRNSWRIFEDILHQVFLSFTFSSVLM